MRGSGSDEARGEPAPRKGSGLMPAPRAYFGQAAAGARRPASDLETERLPPARRLVFRTRDPAVRLFADLPAPALAEVDGAAITLSGAADGDAEWLLIDVSGTAIRRETRRDPAQGTVILTLTGTQAAVAYRPLLATLRYLNRAAAPRPGLRRIKIEMIDAVGERQALADTVVVVETETSAAAAPAPEAGETAAALPIAAPAAAPVVAIPPRPTPPAAAPVERAPPPAIARAEDGANPAVAPAPAGRAADSAPPPALVADNRLAVAATDGDYTLFWWPQAPARRGARRAHPAVGEAAAGPAPAAAHPSFFSAGGRVYRLFAPRPGAEPAPQEGDRLWTTGDRERPPGIDAPPMLRLEDVFGSDMADALTRRAIEQRLAAGM